MTDVCAASDSAELPSGFLEEVDRRLGARGWSIEPEQLALHAAEQWGTWRGRAAVLLRPATTAQVAAVLQLCHAQDVPVVPQGGNTGLVGAGVPDRTGRMAVLSLARLNRVREIDALNDTITTEAGCVLEAVQNAALEADRLFPLSLGAQGSCQIGGNLSSNAGGVNVLRYGMARDLVLGLEVVLADGRIWDGLRALRKDNTGYDLKQLFIGAEGTLGVITAAVLRLLPLPRERQTAWLAVASPRAAVELLALFRARLGETVSSFELLAGECVELVLRYLPGARAPLARRAPWYVLAEVAWSLAEGLGAQLEQVLEEALRRDLIQDGVVAASEAQRRSLWALRENPTEAMAHEGVVLRHDIAVPVSRVPDLIERAGAALGRAVPGVRIMPFGHVGDGNIHYNLLQPEAVRGEAFRARRDEVQRLVLDVVEALGGSISAEHGIGRLKRLELMRRKSALELTLMRELKATLDPKGILNPGAVI
ncbi:MAG TPA: FAD-binding oxidoreductase [Geminicoccaceae bacterium]|nr:FAD-binding oxidoreductase [Geminicoccaceae bacterium]